MVGIVEATADLHQLSLDRDIDPRQDLRRTTGSDYTYMIHKDGALHNRLGFMSRCKLPG